ncbi:MAG TPA: hypothetical protein VKI65_11925 [Gemmataceae bacterium]|nr:hypothetical protein [Gemmataceae bacterium]
MGVLAADTALQAYLAPLKERTEIRDTQGRLLGLFIPHAERQADYSEVRKLFDPEEIKRRKEQEGHLPGSTTAEVLQRLQALGAGQ